MERPKNIKPTDNAKYLTGFVKVKAESYGGEFLFSVRDSGHGINKELLPHLFEEFRRDSAARQIEGIGLGLFIAHEITSARRGEIWAESDGPARGAGFWSKFRWRSFTV